MSAAEKLEPSFNEETAAHKLGISKATLMRDRLAGKVHPMRHGKRTIRYTESILDEYREQCRNAPDKSATTGSPSGPDRSNGAGRGMTPPLDKHDAHRLAQTIFKRPN